MIEQELAIKLKGFQLRRCGQLYADFYFISFQGTAGRLVSTYYCSELKQTCFFCSKMNKERLHNCLMCSAMRK